MARNKKTDSRKIKRRSLTIIIMAIAVAAMVYALYAAGRSCDAICVIGRTLKTENISINGGNATLKIQIYIANTPQEQQRGYMFVNTLGKNCLLTNGSTFSHCEPKGMLFVFNNQSEKCFWMKNTSMPLEQVWIDANGTVVNVYDATPLSKTNICYSGMYVLETNVTYIPVHIGYNVLINAAG